MIMYTNINNMSNNGNDKFYGSINVTGQVESDLLGASLTMLNEVSVDSKKVDKDPIYVDFFCQ